MKKIIYIIIVGMILFSGHIFAQEDSKVYTLLINYDSGNFELENLDLVFGEMPTIFPEDDYYIARIIAFNGDILHEQKFSFSTETFFSPPPEEWFDDEGNQIYIPTESETVIPETDETSFSLILPYYSDARLIEIFDKGENKVLEISLEDFSEITFLALENINNEYLLDGAYTSKAFDTGVSNPYYCSISWDEKKPSGTIIKVRLNSGSDSEISSGLVSSNYYNSPSKINDIHNTRYFKWKARLSTDSSSYSPTLSNLNVFYSDGKNANCCGDGVIHDELNEKCDSGIDNGKKGYCNSDCSGLVKEDLKIEEDSDEPDYKIDNVQLVYSADSPTIRDTIILKNIKAFLSGEGINSEITIKQKKNADLLRGSLVFFVYDREIIFISNGNSFEEDFFEVTSEFLIKNSKKGLISSFCEPLEWDDITGNDLDESLCKIETDFAEEEVKEEEEEPFIEDEELLELVFLNSCMDTNEDGRLDSVEYLASKEKIDIFSCFKSMGKEELMEKINLILDETGNLFGLFLGDSKINLRVKVNENFFRTYGIDVKDKSVVNFEFFEGSDPDFIIYIDEDVLREILTSFDIMSNLQGLYYGDKITVEPVSLKNKILYFFADKFGILGRVISDI